MTIQTAAAKLENASNSLSAARKAQSDMLLLVSAEQTGFERMIPLDAAVAVAQRAQDWASHLLVNAIEVA